MLREDHGEALTGGWAIEPRNTILDADAVQIAEGNTQLRAIASRAAIRRGRRPQHAETFLAREPGDLASDQSGTPLLARIGKTRSRS
jgi:hypothetical protein